jgi:hypothetical protein
MRFSLAFLGILVILGSGLVLPAAALELTYNEYVGTTAELSFEHKDRDVASEETMTNEDPFVLSYEGPFYAPDGDPFDTDPNEQVYGDYNAQDNSVSLDMEGTLNTVPTDVTQPTASTATTVETTQDPNVLEQVNFNIDLNVAGSSSYNKTTIGPLHYQDDKDAGANPPDPAGVQDGTLKYYNNWEMTTADSHAYGGYGGGNAFSVAGNVADVTEQFWITAVFSYEFVLSGEWSYHIIQNENEDHTVAERTGYFWTSSQAGVMFFDEKPENGPDPFFAFASQEYDLRNELTDNELPEGDLGSVFQSETYTGTMTYSFLATEGVNYYYDFFADLYGYADGIASYTTTGWANLALDVAAASPISAPEPATSLLMGLGLLGLLAAYRKRCSK